MLNKYNLFRSVFYFRKRLMQILFFKVLLLMTVDNAVLGWLEIKKNL